MFFNVPLYFYCTTQNKNINKINTREENFKVPFNAFSGAYSIKRHNKTY